MYEVRLREPLPVLTVKLSSVRTCRDQADTHNGHQRVVTVIERTVATWVIVGRIELP